MPALTGLATRASWIPRAATAILAIIVGALTGGAYAASRPTTFSASASLVVNPVAVDKTGLTDSADYILARMQTYAGLVGTNAVLQPVVTKLGGGDTVDGLASRIATKVPAGSTIVSVAVTDSTGERAAAAATKVIESLSSAIITNSPASGSRSTPVKIAILQQGTASQHAAASRSQYGLAGAVVGFIVSELAWRVLPSRRRPGQLATLEGRRAV